MRVPTTTRSTMVSLGSLMMLLSLVVPSLSQTAGNKENGDPAARIRISGIRTLRMKSRIIFRVAPDRPHLMEAAFAFPDRGYSRLVAETPKPSRARVRFQLGEQVFGINPPSTTSRALALEEAATAVRSLALRRALLLWPRTVEWERSGDLATVDLGPAGRLIAHFDPASELPLAIASETVEGDEYERFTNIDWVQPDGEAFARPASMVLEAGGEVVWEEVLLEYDPRANYIDSFFLPPDQRDAKRRTGGTRTNDTGPEVKFHPLPARTVRRVELEGEPDWTSRWSQALEVAGAVEAELQPTGHQLHPALAFELDDACLPTTLVLRLADGGPEALPEGWTPLPVGEGASHFVPGVSAGISIPLATLRAAAEAAERSVGTPYLVARRAPEPGRAQLVLPVLK